MRMKGLHNRSWNGNNVLRKCGSKSDPQVVFEQINKTRSIKGTAGKSYGFTIVNEAHSLQRKSLVWIAQGKERDF